MRRGKGPDDAPRRQGDPDAVGGRTGVAAALCAILLLQGVSAGQEQEAGQERERDCTLVRVGGYTISQRFDSANYTHRASGGMDYRCTDGTRVLADSAVVWEHSGNLVLVERVRFEDADTELDADSAYYFGNVRELRAWSGVMLTDRRSGAVLTGDTLNYLRQSRFRRLDRIRVHGGDPRAVVYPPRRPAAPVAEAAAPEPAPAPEGPGTETDAPAAGDPGGEGREPAADSMDAERERAPDNLPGEEPEPVPDSLAGGAGEVVEDIDGGEADVPADSVTPPPYEVEAPRLYIDGRRFFRAGGGVVVTRDSLQAFGDSLDYDQEVGVMLIFGNAHVVDRGFDLRSAAVSVTPAAGLNEEILAREDARLTGDQVLMRAPAIRLFLRDGQVNRIVALPSVVPMPGDDEEELVDTAGLTPGDVARARALAEDVRRKAEGDTAAAPDSLPRPAVTAAEFNLTGDSIDVLSPNQLLDVVTAVGGARAEAMSPDSARDEDLPEVAAGDWIEGRRIVARFTSEQHAADSAVTGADTTAGRVRLESLTATSDARSLYRLLPSDTALEESDGLSPESDTPAARFDSMPTESEISAPAADGAQPDAASAGAEAGTPPAETGGDPGETDVQPGKPDTLRGEEPRPAALHYVRGNEITIHLEGRKVVRMEVQGQTVGYHFEPLPPDSLPAAGDSAAAVPDSAGAATDTTVAARDTTVASAGTARTPPDTTRVPAANRRRTPRHSGESGFRHLHRPPVHRGQPGARE